MNKWKYQNKLGKLLCTYTIFVFLFLPLGNMIAAIYQNDQPSLVELQDSFEKDKEDLSEEDNSKEDYKVINRLSSSVSNDTNLIIPSYALSLRNTALDVITPPPEGSSPIFVV